MNPQPAACHPEHRRLGAAPWTNVRGVSGAKDLLYRYDRNITNCPTHVPKIELPERYTAMKLTFALATPVDAAELATLHSAASEDLTRRFGRGFWSSSPSVRGILANMRLPKFSRVLIARSNRRIVGTLRLATKKPWAIDISYFTPIDKALYLTGMAVHPNLQRKGIGRLLLKQAEEIARAWPADAIRLDAFDDPAGAGPFYAKCGYREVARVIYKKDLLIYFEQILSS
jgi:ribosomal protein S18 acetylase RimI-like enzyme